MKLYPIADLHCDLLYYLEGGSQRTCYDPESRCSVPQLRSGLVKFQTLAVFCETGVESVKKGMTQVGIYRQLHEQQDGIFARFNEKLNDGFISHKIATFLAFEGASTFCYEDELLENGFKRLEHVINNIAHPLYISLTWNMENRFGGGASTKIGLKEDGRWFLQFLDRKKIAIDLSHASDLLAHDILNFIDKFGLDIPVMASHSNARSISNVPRNLSDELGREILRRRGIIGLNFYRNFVGPAPEEYFKKHLSHWIELGGESQICFGADFFFTKRNPTHIHKDKEDESFFENYSNASCYPYFLENCRNHYGMTEKLLENLSHRNFLSFLKRIGRA